MKKRLEKKVWVLELANKEPTVVFFSSPITIGEAWSIWRKDERYSNV